MDTYDTMEKGLAVPIINSVLLPGVTTAVHLSESNKWIIDALEQKETALIAIPYKGKISKMDFQEEDFHRYGVSFLPIHIEKNEQGAFVQIKTLERIRADRVYREEGSLYADYISCPDQNDLDEKSQQEILEYFRRVIREISERFQNGDEFVKIVEGITDINSMITYLSQFMTMAAEEKYEYLKMDSLKERSLRFMDALLKQEESIELNLRFNEKFSKKANRYYREQVLQEQLKAIQEELNQGQPKGRKDSSDYRARIEEAWLPEEVREAALEEVEKLGTQGQGNAEENIIRNYLDFLLKLPWKKEEGMEIDLEKARRILNEDHYGLQKVKERILQHLAVMKLKNDKLGSILLLVGPPGTGKTSLGKSIARALERNYVRLSFGGIRDEAEIRGHRRTYIGALPGNILKSMKKAGTTNPVMVLDEVDKLMPGGFNGDPASALLEVLDPEQNNTFTDHYLDLSYDLSDVFFIATANSTDTIPGPLLDRMEVIQISGYTEDEKMHIAMDHLIPDVLKDHGLAEGQVVIGPDVLNRMIHDYTREAGVRGLKKQLAAVARTVSEKIVMHETELPYTVKEEELEEMLGPQVSRHDMAQVDNPPGVVTGLAWTPVGGEILFIEATDMPGSGEVVLTGKLGDVMKESAMISLSLLKSRLPLNAVNFKERDIHIHVPSGAVPKDGPSAGIALFTALASLFTGRKVDSKLAMTGEITLRGAVLPIGGLKEKLLAAQWAGIKKVLIPRENTRDLKELPREIREQMTIIAVDTIEDVLRETIGISLPRIEHVMLGEQNGGKALFQ